MSTVISLGCRARSASEPKPARAMAPGARFWMKTSALATKRSSSALSSAFLMLRTTLSLPRLSHTK
jgi:hypothetical protein